MFRYVDALCLLPLYMYPKTHTLPVNHAADTTVQSKTTVYSHKCIRKLRTDETYTNYTKYINIYNKLKNIVKNQIFYKFKSDIKMHGKNN